MQKNHKIFKMKIYSFETLTIGTDGFYDLSQKTLNYNDSTSLLFRFFIVTDEFAGRAFNLSNYLHGSTLYMEEFCMVNNIINPYSIQAGQIVRFLDDPTQYQNYYGSDPVTSDIKDQILNMNNSKSTQSDPNRIGYPPTIKPDNLSQIDVNTSSKKITIINKFK
jgi:hypothetical protein